MSYDDHYKWAKGEFQKIETSKKQVIIELAERLENSGMLVESICAEISNNLSKDGYVSDRYVRDVLEKTKYKRKYENKDMEDIGTRSELELEKDKAQELNRAKIIVSNTGKQVSSTLRPRDEDKLVPVSDLVGLARAIEDRDNTIKGWKEKYAELQKQIISNEKLPRPEQESKVIEKLMQDIEGANMEIDFLKGQNGGERIIALKSRIAEDHPGQCYWGTIRIHLLKSKIKELEASGIKQVEIFMRLIT